jgi:hypothetical protein
MMMTISLFGQLGYISQLGYIYIKYIYTFLIISLDCFDKVDARFAEPTSPMSPAVQRSASAGPVRAKVDYNSLLYSEEAAKKAEEVAAERRKVKRSKL